MVPSWLTRVQNKNVCFPQHITSTVQAINHIWLSAGYMA